MRVVMIAYLSRKRVKEHWRESFKDERGDYSLEQAASGRHPLSVLGNMHFHLKCTPIT